MSALLVAGGASAVIEWVAVAAGLRRWEYLAKPAAIACLIAWLVLVAPRPLPAQLAVFIAALSFSLLGDVLLILPGDRFAAGLAAFLLAHLAYVAAFNWEGVTGSLSRLSLGVVLAFVAVLLLRRLRSALIEKGRGRLVPALAVYAVALAVMLWSTLALGEQPGWAGVPAALAAVGGALFYLSDVGIAWNLFVQPIPGGRLWTMVAYHFAQYAIAGAVALRFAGR